jgi:hypothetical protein
LEGILSFNVWLNLPSTLGAGFACPPLEELCDFAPWLLIPFLFSRAQKREINRLRRNTRNNRLMEGIAACLELVEGLR